MKVRWGSTLAMLNRADLKQDVSHDPLSFVLLVTHDLLQFVDEFVFELRRKETNTEKRRKLGDLALTEEEWDRVRLFCNLLQVFECLFVSSPRRLPLVIALACRHRSAGLFGRNTTDSSQCPSCNREDVQRLAEGIGEAALQCFQACT